MSTRWEDLTVHSPQMWASLTDGKDPECGYPGLKQHSLKRQPSYDYWRVKKKNIWKQASNLKAP